MLFRATKNDSIKLIGCNLSSTWVRENCLYLFQEHGEPHRSFMRNTKYQVNPGTVSVLNYIMTGFLPRGFEWPEWDKGLARRPSMMQSHLSYGFGPSNPKQYRPNLTPTTTSSLAPSHPQQMQHATRQPQTLAYRHSTLQDPPTAGLLGGDRQTPSPTRFNPSPIAAAMPKQETHAFSTLSPKPANIAKMPAASNVMGSRHQKIIASTMSPPRPCELIVSVLIE